jgi:2'-5' RNA ligase
MNESATVQELIADSKGRGAWIGLFPSEPVVINGVTPDDAHVTLAHLGRGVQASAIAEAHAACESRARYEMPPARAKVDGTARLEQKAGSAIVLLLRDDELRRNYNEMVSSLSFRGVYYDQKFPFRAHLTLEKILPAATVPFARVDPSQVIIFNRLALVVGDKRAWWTLQEPQ